jgi:uncharacterized protein
VTVLSIRVTTADDYLARREPHRKAHIERLEGLRTKGVLVGGGPAPDGRSADIVYRVAAAAQLTRLVEEDPYWRGAVWTAYRARSFRHFVDRLVSPSVVLDGTRRLTIVEGPTADTRSAPDALLALRDAGRVEFGGLLDQGLALVVLACTASAEEALGWLAQTGAWDPARLTARPLLYVL